MKVKGSIQELKMMELVWDDLSYSSYIDQEEKERGIQRSLVVRRKMVKELKIFLIIKPQKNDKMFVTMRGLGMLIKIWIKGKS